MKINRIAVIGGGTAGWLAANYLAQTLNDAQVTLIESPDVPTIGVGEGTVPAIRATLQRFGISETDFIRECDVSFKQGIKFIDWLDSERHGAGNFYYHLFDYPFPYHDDLTPFWLNSTRQQHYADTVSVQGRLCEAGLAPKKITTPEYDGVATYAYHLNAGKFAKLLARHATNRFSVTHLHANVTDLFFDDSGFITALLSDAHGRLEFDFYIDCTGFAAYLLGQKMRVPFLDRSRQLPVDTALVAQVPTAADIPPYTLATAHSAGWIWDIALPTRRGVGFVYSGNHMSDEQAHRQFEQYLNYPGDLQTRKLPMPVGRRSQFWLNNCVAIGLSQGFVEPLEATAILFTDYSAKMLANKFPRCRTDIPALQSRYNTTLTYAWERIFEFVKLHYCISDRSDSEFWLDNRNTETIPETLQQRLQLWRSHSPTVDDFFSKFEVFDVENYLYVLYGMHFDTKIATPAPHYLALANYRLQNIVRQASRLSAELPKHRQLLEKIRLHGLQKV